MKYLVIALVSSPVLLAYHLKPVQMQGALFQALHFVLQQIARG